jgi:hypothetical protein
MDQTLSILGGSRENKELGRLEWSNSPTELLHERLRHLETET